MAQLCAWLEEMARHLAEPDERGCTLANAAIELPEKDHPARRVIEEYKRAQRTRLVRLSEEAGLGEPEMLADELHLLLEERASLHRASAPKDLQPASCTWARR